MRLTEEPELSSPLHSHSPARMGEHWHSDDDVDKYEEFNHANTRSLPRSPQLDYGHRDEDMFEQAMEISRFDEHPGHVQDEDLQLYPMPEKGKERT